MFIKIVFILMLMVTLGYAIVAVDRDNPAAQRYARRDIDNMRSFVFSVGRFVGANPSFDGVVSWEGGSGSTAIRHESSTPPSLRGVSMPQAWRAVVADGDYLLCTPFSEAALALLASEMPEALRNNPVKAGDGSQSMVFAMPKDFSDEDDGPSPAKKWAQQCATL